MRTHRIALIIAACLLPALLGMAYFGRTRVTMWIYTGGSTTVVAIDVPNDNGDGASFFFCGEYSPGCSRLCASCHTGGQDKSKEVYTVEKHEKGYYQRSTVTPLAGQRLSYGSDGGYLTSNSGRLEFFTKDGTLRLTTPTGSSLLKDAAGRPFLLWMPGEPTLPPKPR